MSYVAINVLTVPETGGEVLGSTVWAFEVRQSSEGAAG